MYAYSRSWGYAATAFFFGVFIDLDHLIDFFREHSWRDIGKFIDVMVYVDLRQLWLLFHSLELLLALWGAIVIFRLNGYWISAAQGLSLHMLLDIIGNPIGIRGYWFLYRLNVGFKTEKLILRDTEYYKKAR
ncbi:MAG: hypothetical protein PHS37_01505 [Candidatus Omnitrophica bacterium]|nr:hypothetical protein [Candidatus Omnitrophota bacterium]